MMKLATIAASAILLGAVSAEAQETLKVGAIGSLSGGGTAWGQAIQRGTQLAADDANAAGGVKVGDKTYKVEIVMYDDKYTGQGGKDAAERLVFQDKVKYIIGPIGSNPALSTVAVTTPEKVVVLSNGYASAVLKNEAKAPYNFRVTLTNGEFAPKMVKWIAENVKPKKVGILAPNDAIGQSVVPGLAQIYKDNGIEVWSDMFERGTKEFTPLITRMIAAGVDALELNFNAPGEAGLLVKQARQAGFRKTIIQTGGPAVPEIVEIAGLLAEGFISYEMYDFDAPRAQGFVKAYRAKYGEGIISAQTPAFYNATKILFEALHRAGTLDTDKVRDAIEKMEGYDAGVFGPVKWTGMKDYGVNHQIDLPFFIVEVKGGKEVTRATIEP